MASEILSDLRRRAHVLIEKRRQLMSMKRWAFACRPAVGNKIMAEIAAVEFDIDFLNRQIAKIEAVARRECAA